MSYDYFLKILLTYKKFHEDLRDLYGDGFDFYDGKYRLSEQMDNFLEIFLNVQYTPEGSDWINWYIFENDYGQRGLDAKDEHGELICNSFESLWEYVKQYEINKVSKGYLPVIIGEK